MSILRVGRNGQLFSVDLALSLVAFLVLFIVIMGFWNLYSLRLNQDIAVEETNLLAIQITDILVDSPGVPADWEEQVQNAEVLGLSRSRGRLDPGKVSALTNISEQKLKQLFNIERFAYRLQLTDRNGTILLSRGFASPPPGQEIVSVQRVVLLQNETTYVTLWLS